MSPTDQRLDRLLIALDYSLDSTIAAVAYPSVDAVLEGPPAEGIAKTDPLHDPVNRQVGCRRGLAQR